jgi:arylsulfatase A-like enzyme
MRPSHFLAEKGNVPYCPTQTRREFLGTVGAGLGVIAASCRPVRPPETAPPRRRPNIVLVLCDDLGYADLGCYGARGFETPNIDRLAAEGIRFTDFYVSQAVCSASRASLLSGCYAERVGIQGALGPASKIGLNPDEETIAELLKAQGYATAIFGKWHLGFQAQFLPRRQGFDEYVGLPYSNDMWPFGYDGKPVTTGAKAAYPPLPLIRNEEKIGEIASLADQDRLTTLYAENAVRFISENMDRPFFLYLPHSMPHTPLGVSDKFRGQSSYGKYGDVVMEIDWSVGEILKTLARYRLERDTLVIFTSDNGPWLNFGNHAGTAGPLREGKGTMFEGGARVPCVMRWPGHIPAGRACSNIAATIDLLPTLAAIAGAPNPVKKIDGVDVRPLLEGRSDANPRDHYFYYYAWQLRAVRRGRWKLMFPHTTTSYAGRPPGQNGLPGPTVQVQTELALYDLAADIGERHDVLQAHPDIVAELQALAETAREELGDSLTGRKGKGIREPGRIADS